MSQEMPIACNRAFHTADLGGRRRAASATRPTYTLAVIVLAAATLAACSAAERLSQIGQVPPLSEIENPSTLHGNRPVQMPMPAPVEARHHPNSLWRPGSKHFLQDQRASDVGDILTVNIEIADNAQLENTTARQRDNSESAALPNFLGFEGSMAKYLPDGFDPTEMVGIESDGSSSGSGSVDRGETINLQLAALVTQVLPNGNLVIAGRQEVRVNFEVRELQVAGLIRPEDITNINTIDFDQIAEARISYGGRGQISDVQQPRYGQQLYDILWPF
jgi:flagellar L-ring protein precursor FlgH